MTIYVLRSDNLVKIGFTENLRLRVRTIASGIPVAIEFVGYMPGDRAVERHLHDRFAATRFSGEWFVETPAMTACFDALLTAGLPEPERKPKAKKRRCNDSNIHIKETLRDEAARRWPHLSHRDRVARTATELGWNMARVKDFYHGDSRAVIREAEAAELREWANGRAFHRALVRPGTEGA